MTVFKVAVIAAARGGFIRAAPLLAELGARPELEVSFIFAGEDYVSHAASEVFRELALPYADVVIAASEGTPAQRLAKIMAGCERLAVSGDLAAVVLVGASHALLGCALASARSVPVVAHADAGLRLPGSAGRISLAARIDRLATALMAASEPAHCRLLDEGALEDSVVLAGSLACDAVAQCIGRARADNCPARAGLQPKGYALAIIESPYNIDRLANLHKLVELLSRAQECLPVALGVNARLATQLENWGLAQAVASLPRLSSVEPAGYVEYLSFLDAARMVLTDVGGVQDEATFLGVPCLTLAEATDRAATVETGANLLVSLDLTLAMQAVEALTENEYLRPPLPAAWDGRASQRIAHALTALLRGNAAPG